MSGQFAFSQFANSQYSTDNPLLIGFPAPMKHSHKRGKREEEFKDEIRKSEIELQIIESVLSKYRALDKKESERSNEISQLLVSKAILKAKIRRSEDQLFLMIAMRQKRLRYANAF